MTAGARAMASGVSGAFVVTVLALALIPLGPGLHAQSPYETPPVLKANDLVPSGLIVGQGYRVADRVATTGLVGEFTLESDVGTLEPHGVDLLRIRVGEPSAIRQLEDTSKTSEFVKAAGRAAVPPVEATANMLRHPVDTLTGMPAGIGPFFDRVKLGGEAVASAATSSDKSGLERTGDGARPIPSWPRR